MPKQAKTQKQQAFLLSPKARQLLKKPFGRLFCKPDEAAKAHAFLSKRAFGVVAVVGDCTFESLRAAGVLVDLAIVDGQTLRKKTGFSKHLPKKRGRAANPAGTITKSLFDSIRKAAASLSKASPQQAILVSGEEDLAVLPAVLFLPQGSVIFYGQPKKGIVAVVVDDKAKRRVLAILKGVEKRKQFF
ncbi:MAG: GTP-dependent dephospho-CoA kinase family protein [Candidatus Micrarchaeia archaeon]|jgi:hypothetical protein